MGSDKDEKKFSQYLAANYKLIFKASFCLELDLTIEQILSKAAEVKRGELGENVKDWLEGEKIVSFLLETIESPDSNAWSVATDLGEGMGKFRNTLSEPIQRCLKRACGIADDKTHFEAVLYKEVLPDIHARYLKREGGAVNRINPDHFRRAQLQLAQCRKFYGADAFKVRVSKRFAVSRPTNLPEWSLHSLRRS